MNQSVNSNHHDIACGQIAIRSKYFSKCFIHWSTCESSVWFDSFEPLQTSHQTLAMLYSSLKRVEQHSNLSKPLYSLFKEQRERSNQGSTHSNLSEPLHSLSNQQREWSDCGLTHSNISEPLHSLSKQQRERSDRGLTQLNLSELLHSRRESV